MAEQQQLSIFTNLSPQSKVACELNTNKTNNVVAETQIKSRLDNQNNHFTEREALTWREVLAGEKEKDYFQKLTLFLEREFSAGKTIYPKKKDVFNALSYTEFSKVRVVILGQDPYHGPNQAHGLCFSVRKGVPLPPSLVNIFKELYSDLGVPKPTHGCLEGWAQSGVLLLNSVLTVEAGKPASHGNIGWEIFTDKIVAELNLRKKDLVFLLWGAYAHKKGSVLDESKHLILRAPHPSPFSADKGFFGCKHFSKTNNYLKSRGYSEISWAI